MTERKSTTGRRSVAPYAWRKAALAPDKLPDAPGCYAIYFDRQLAYIGQTTSIRKRFQNYNFRSSYGASIITPWGFTEGRPNITLKYKPGRRYGDWAMRELRLIRRLQPPLNCAGSSRKRNGTKLPWHSQTHKQAMARLKRASAVEEAA